MDALIDDFIGRCIFCVCRVYTKFLHLIIPQIINGYRCGLQDTKADNGGDLLVYSLCQ